MPNDINHPVWHAYEYAEYLKRHGYPSWCIDNAIRAREQRIVEWELSLLCE